MQCSRSKSGFLPPSVGETEQSKRASRDKTGKRCFNGNLFEFQVQDSSIAGSSDDEDLLGVIRGETT